MSLRKYGFMVDLVGSIHDEEKRKRCASAIRLHNRAIGHISKGQFFDAIARDTEALQLAEGIPEAETLKALCHANIGLAHANSGAYREAISENLNALPTLKATPRLSDELATCLNSLGCSYIAIGDMEEGARHLETAISIWSHDPSASHKIAAARDNLRVATADRRSGGEANSLEEFDRYKDAIGCLMLAVTALITILALRAC